MFKPMDTDNYLSYFGLCYILAAALSKFFGVDINGSIITVISFVSFFLVWIEFENMKEQQLHEREQKKGATYDNIRTLRSYRWIQRRKIVLKLFFAASLIILPFSDPFLEYLKPHANSFALAAIGLSLILHGFQKEKSIHDYLDLVSEMIMKNVDLIKKKAETTEKKNEALKEQADLLKERVDLMSEVIDIKTKEFDNEEEKLPL